MSLPATLLPELPIKKVWNQLVFLYLVFKSSENLSIPWLPSLTFSDKVSIISLVAFLLLSSVATFLTSFHFLSNFLFAISLNYEPKTKQNEIINICDSIKIVRWDLLNFRCCCCSTLKENVNFAFSFTQGISYIKSKKKKKLNCERKMQT